MLAIAYAIGRLTLRGRRYMAEAAIDEAIDAELSRLLDAWPRLAAATRGEILARMEAVASAPELPGGVCFIAPPPLRVVP